MRTFGRTGVVGILVSSAALVALIVHVAAPKLKIDSIAIALLVLAALPWLGEILESVDLPGGGGFRYRKRLEELEEKTERVAAKTDSVADRVDDEVERGQDAQGAFARSAADPDVNGVGVPRASEIQDLAAQYNEIRATQLSGFQRTSAMTAIVRKMMQVFDNADDFAWRPALDSSDRGMRLAGYAYLTVRPQPGAAERLVRTLLEREDKPFGQYWALKALRKVAAKDEAISDLLPALEDYQRKLQPGTDRARELSDLIEQVRSEQSQRGSE